MLWPLEDPNGYGTVGGMFHERLWRPALYVLRGGQTEVDPGRDQKPVA